MQDVESSRAPQATIDGPSCQLRSPSSARAQLVDSVGVWPRHAARSRLHGSVHRPCYDVRVLGECAELRRARMVLLALALGASSAGAAELDYRAPEGCPSRDELIFRIERGL